MENSIRRSVYGFRGDLIMNLNFNWCIMEIDNENDDNMEMVSLCNNGDDKDEG